MIVVVVVVVVVMILVVIVMVVVAGAVDEIGPRRNQRDLRFRLRVSSPRNGVVQITSSIVSEKHCLP